MRALRDNERLLGISLATVLVMSGQGVISPVLPLFALQLGADVASVGLTLSSFALARLLLNVPLGIAADRHGRRALLVGGPLLGAAGMVGSGLAEGVPELLVWRGVAGAGSAMYMTAAQTYLTDISTPQNRARVLATNQGALLLGVSIGPAIGGVLGEGFGLAAPFHVVGAAGVLTAAYAFLRLPETRPGGARGAAEEPAPGVSWRDVVGSRDFAAVSFVTAAVFLTRAGGRMTLLPLLAAARYGYSAGELGALFTAMALINLIGLAPAAQVADRFGRKWAIVPSGLVVSSGLALMAADAGQPLFLLAALTLAVGSSVAGPAPAAYAADIAPPAARGLAMGLYRTAGDAGMVIGPYALGAIADLSSIPWALAANAAIVAAASIGFALAARETAAGGPGAEPPAPLASGPPQAGRRSAPAAGSGGSGG